MITIVAFLCHIFFVHGLTCDEILELPESQKMTLSDLQTVQPKEVVHCLAHLGKERLGQQEAEYIWQSVVTFYGGVSNVPDSTLTLLRWVTPALSPDDYANMTFSDIDVVQNFGLNYGLDEAQLSALAERVREDFASKEPEDYTYYDLVALRQILCAFNQSEIERIHPAAYREAALVIGKLEHCKVEVMQGFAALVVHPRAFGPPHKWSAATVQILGEVAKFLPSAVRSQLEIRDNNN